MTEDSFDPFDLPATFDPLAPVAPAPPRRRRLAEAGALAPAPGASAGGGAGGRLAHLLRPRAGETASTVDADASVAALAARVAILEARLDSLEARLIARLQTHGSRPTVDRPGPGKAI